MSYIWTRYKRRAQVLYGEQAQFGAILQEAQFGEQEELAGFGAEAVKQKPRRRGYVPYNKRAR